MSSLDLHLISFDICPYVQRAMVLLNEKNAEYRITYIDLANKPEWFLKISPLGKVPVLQVDSTVLFESSVICEYIDETHGQILHPSDPLERAKHRSWMEFSSALLGLVYGIYTSGTEDEYAAKKQELHHKLSTLEVVLGKGPYFAGTKFTMVDAFYGSVFRYLEVFSRWGDSSYLAEYPKLKLWAAEVLKRPSVQKAVPEDYEEKFKNYLKSKNGYYARKMKIA